MVVGWREWLALPALGLPAVKAKIDTGARTSALHAFSIRVVTRGGGRYARFLVHPLQHNTRMVRECSAEIVDRRMVTDSGGHRERRYVVATPVRLGTREWNMELTLTDRDTMLFRMLLGRTAMHGRLLVDPRASFLHGRPDLPLLYPTAPVCQGARD